MRSSRRTELKDDCHLIDDRWIVICHATFGSLHAISLLNSLFWYHVIFWWTETRSLARPRIGTSPDTQNKLFNNCNIKWHYIDILYIFTCCYFYTVKISKVGFFYNGEEISNRLWPYVMHCMLRLRFERVFEHVLANVYRETGFFYIDTCYSREKTVSLMKRIPYSTAKQWIFGYLFVFANVNMFK